MLGVIRSARRACLQIGRRTGGFVLVGDSQWRRNRLLILCYHGISLDDEHLWDGALYMRPDVLAGRLALLRARHCHVIALHEAIERLYADDLPSRSVVITFDDGYHDFAESAFPLLGEYGYPATVYLPTLHCGNDAPVFAIACSYVLWKARGGRYLVPDVRRAALDLTTSDGVREAVAAVKAVARRDNLTPAEKNLLLQRVAAALDVDYEGIAARGLLRIMGPAEVKRLTDAGVDFQLHTHRHRAPLDRAAFMEEIETNRSRLEGMTGKRARHFCYPSGAYETEFLPWLEALGIVTATTCDPGLAANDTPPLMLPRFVDTSSTSTVEFEGWLSGAAAWLTPGRSYAHNAVSA